MKQNFCDLHFIFLCIVAVIILKKKNNITQCGSQQPQPQNCYHQQQYSGDRHEIQSISQPKTKTNQHEEPDRISRLTDLASVQSRIRNAFDTNSSTMVANVRNDIDCAMREGTPTSPSYKRYRSRSPKPPDKPGMEKKEEEQVKVYVVDDATDQIDYSSGEIVCDGLVSPRVCSPINVNAYDFPQPVLPKLEQPDSVSEIGPPPARDSTDVNEVRMNDVIQGYIQSQSPIQIHPRIHFESVENGHVPPVRALINPPTVTSSFNPLPSPSTLLLSNKFKRTKASDLSRQSPTNEIPEKSQLNSGSCNRDNFLPSFEQPHKKYEGAGNGQRKASEEISCLVEIDMGARKELTAEIKKRYDRVEVDGSMKYVCKMCDKMFERWCNLNAHVTMHLDMKPYVCKMCGVKYKLRAILNHHIRSNHIGDRPYYKCKQCGGKFKNHSSLQQHLLSMKHQL